MQISWRSQLQQRPNGLGMRVAGEKVSQTRADSLNLRCLTHENQRDLFVLVGLEKLEQVLRFDSKAASLLAAERCMLCGAGVC